MEGKQKTGGVMLELNLFGAAQAHYSDQPLVGFPNQQAHLLLCYLLLNRERSHHRERLATLFWSEYPTQVSLKYLRNAIWRIRKVFQSVGAPADEYLSVENGSISFKCSSPYWLDVEAFETQVTSCEGTPGQRLTFEQANHLEGAIDIYIGDLLEGVYEDWCLYDRERLGLLYLNTLSKLMTFHEVNATYERALTCGDRILAHDNTREKVHRQMMRLYWLMGDRDAALTQYQHCTQILHESLGLLPMEETTRLYQQMVHNQFRPTIQPDTYNTRLPFTVSPDESTQVMMEYALQRIHRLHATIDEASAELHHIEHFIRETMFNPQGR
jgi:DNA-binding SARP family transcriptional activator